MIHKENDYQIQVKKRGHQTRLVRMINRNARKFFFWGQGFMERNMALLMGYIGFVQLDTKQHFFDTTSAQGDLGRSSGQVVVVYKLCKCKFKGKTLKGQKIPTQVGFVFFCKKG
jgi:hypothetical protein